MPAGERPGTQGGQPLERRPRACRVRPVVGLVGGKRPEAEKALTRLLQLSRERYVSPYHVAIACNGLNEPAQALAWLERAFEEHDPMMVFLNVEPKWKNLRNDPQFRRLLKKMKFPWARGTHRPLHAPAHALFAGSGPNHLTHPRTTRVPAILSRSGCRRVVARSAGSRRRPRPAR